MCLPQWSSAEKRLIKEETWTLEGIILCESAAVGVIWYLLLLCIVKLFLHFNNVSTHIN